MASTYTYRIGPLGFTSDVPLSLPEAGPESAAPVRITIRAFDLREQEESGFERFEIDDRVYFLSARDATIWHPGDGVMTGQATAREILDVVLPELLSLLGMVVLHASVVERNHKAILMTGSSGAGKSTLALTLVRHGWRSGADDFVIVGDDLSIEYLGGPIRVWPDVERATGVTVLDHSVRGKAIVQRPWIARVNQIAAVVILCDPVEDDVTLFEIEGSSAFNQLIQACFRKAAPGEEALRRQIDVISRIVDEKPVKGLAVPHGLPRLDRTAEEVSELFKGLIE